MKCDELKRKYSDITGPYYGYNEVNEAIAELQAENAELKAENKRLKKKMDDYHLMSDIRRAKIKELKRALWKARKAHAVAMFAYWDSHYRDNPNAVYRNRTIDWLRNRWLLILDAIIKKEKEYK